MERLAESPLLVTQSIDFLPKWCIICSQYLLLGIVAARSTFCKWFGEFLIGGESSTSRQLVVYFPRELSPLTETSQLHNRISNAYLCFDHNTLTSSLMHNLDLNYYPIKPHEFLTSCAFRIYPFALALLSINKSVPNSHQFLTLRKHIIPLTRALCCCDTFSPCCNPGVARGPSGS